MGTLFSEMLAQRMGTGSPLCSPTLIFKIEAAPLVPALGPRLSDFCRCCFGLFFSFYIYSLVSAPAAAPFRVWQQPECDLSVLTNISLRCFSYTHKVMLGEMANTHLVIQAPCHFLSALVRSFPPSLARAGKNPPSFPASASIMNDLA